jgi:hypothetical protein
MATRWLGYVIHNNRNVKAGKVFEMLADMEAGRWMVTHQGIAFSPDGQLIDGQHRLHAVVQYGKPVEMLVNVNCDPATFDKLDTGSLRSGADVLTIAGHKYASQLSSAATLDYAYENEKHNTGGTGSKGLTRAALVEYVDTVPGLVDSCEFTVKFLHDVTGWLGIPTLAFVHYHAKRVSSKAKADEFIEAVAVGECLLKGDPAFTLRNRFKKIAMNPLSRVRPWTKAIMLIRAWNAWIREEELFRIQVTVPTDDKGRPIGAPLPRIVGKKRGQKKK